MPVRGRRNPMPTRGGKPTGIFSSRGVGKQKMDSTDGYNKSLNRYALSGGGEVKGKPKGNGNPGLRHQKPKRRKG